MKGTPLSPRQLEVLQLAANGKPRKAIARVMGVSVHHVSELTRGIFKKLGVNNAPGAVAEGFRKGLLK